jgi:hypothetical protein
VEWGRGHDKSKSTCRGLAAGMVGPIDLTLSIRNHLMDKFDANRPTTATDFIYAGGLTMTTF